MKASETPTARSLLMAAAGHLASAELMRVAGEPDPDNGLHSVSMWFLMGWTTELVLKAAILQSGGSEAECRKAGHDLLAALTALTKRGYVTNVKNIENLARDLNITHQSFFFRYMPAADTEVPGNSRLCLAVLRAFIVEVGSFCGLPDQPDLKAPEHS